MSDKKLSSHYIIPLFLMIMILAGCMGKNYRPVVDPKGVDMTYFEVDLVECQAISAGQSVLAESAQKAAAGAVAGAVVGSIIGAIYGEAGEGAVSGAGYGGASGAIDGAVSGLEGQSQIIANCMAGRGYKVLR